MPVQYKNGFFSSAPDLEENITPPDTSEGFRYCPDAESKAVPQVLKGSLHRNHDTAPVPRCTPEPGWQNAPQNPAPVPIWDSPAYSAPACRPVESCSVPLVTQSYPLPAKAGIGKKLWRIAGVFIAVTATFAILVGITMGIIFVAIDTLAPMLSSLEDVRLLQSLWP